jgi:hypothetical protein
MIAHASIHRFGKHLPTAAPALTRSIHRRRRLLHQASRRCPGAPRQAMPTLTVTLNR